MSIDTTHISPSCAVCGGEDPTGLCCTEPAPTRRYSADRLHRALRLDQRPGAAVIAVSPSGYSLTAAHREAAYSLARTVLNASEADPEAGDVDVRVSAAGAESGPYIVRVSHDPR